MRITKADLKEIIKQEIMREPGFMKAVRANRKLPGVAPLEPDDLADDVEEVEEGKEKKKKKWCGGAGNPYHDLDGKFVDPDKEAGSSSKHASTPQPCKHGQSRRPSANRGERFTRVRCGRGSKYKCKGGEKWEEGKYKVLTKAQDKREKERKSLSKERKRSWLNQVGRQLGLGITESDLEETVRNETLKYMQEMHEDRVQDPKKFRARCKALGFQTYDQFLQAVNRLAAAEKGDLHKPLKKERKNIVDSRNVY